MGLYEQLAENFPEELTDFGLCLLVPVSAFRPEWNEQLRSEGVKVFQQSYNGRMFFFLKKPDSQSVEAQPKLEPSKQPLKPKRFEWNEEIAGIVEQLRRQGLSHRKIALKLKEMGFNVSPTTIHRKLRRLIQKVRNDDKDSLTVMDSLGELISVLNLLYPKYRLACKVLLQNFQVFLEGEKEGKLKGFT